MGLTSFCRSIRNRRGFSVLELAVVVAVIGLLAAIAVPMFSGQRSKSQDAVSLSALRNVAATARALAANTEAEGLRFPGEDTATFIDALKEAEREIRLVSNPTSSDDPNEVWVAWVSLNMATYASKSDSGKCWYLYDLLVPAHGYTAGGHWFFDNNPDTRDECGRSIPLQDADEDLTPYDEVETDPGGPVGTPEDPVEAYCEAACLTASIWGDPHIVTFDGLGYEFQTKGEYTAMRSTQQLEAQGGVPIVVQLRSDSRFGSERVSYVTGAAVQYGDLDIVSIVADEANGAELKVGGDVVVLEDEQVYTLGSGLDGADLHTGYVKREGSTYLIVAPGDLDMNVPRAVVEVVTFSSFLNLNFALTAAYAELVEGLLGNADGDALAGPYDDLRPAGGEPLEIPVSNHVIHTSYAATWAVAEADSLFNANGHGYLPRDDAYPERFQIDEPVSDFSDYAPEDVAAAIAACENAGVHPYLLEACAHDTLNAGGDVTLRNAALWGATHASRPRLMNSYDAWQRILTFSDGQNPTTKGWTQPAPGTLGLSISYDGKLRFSDNGSGYHWYWCRADVVTNNFTFQADVYAEAYGNAPWGWGTGFTEKSMGLSIADGSNLWWVQIGPASIVDGNDPTKIFNTNAHTRAAQVRLAKSGTTVSLYVDGHYAFDLTPDDPTVSLAKNRCTSGNWVSFGHIVDDGKTRGVVTYDNVAYSAENKGDLGMNIWSPSPWSHILHFADELSPNQHGWRWGGPEGILNVGLGFEEGAVYVDDNTDSNYYRHFLLERVVGDTFVFQTDVKVTGRSPGGHTTNDIGVLISDGTQQWWLSLGTLSIKDGNDFNNLYATNLQTRYAQVRLVKQGDEVKAYIDNEYAFDLTPSEATHPNGVAFGMLGFEASGRGKAYFDNVMVAGTTEDLPKMTTWPTWQWIRTLDFGEDGVEPTADGWVHDSSWTTSGTSRVVANGYLQYTDTGSSADYWHRYRLNNVVSQKFTFQADVQVPGYIKALGNKGSNGHKADTMGMLLADGTNMWWVRFGPTYISDGNEDPAVVSKRYVTDLYHRFAQVRIVKNGSVASLYVDGHYAFDLTPVAADTWGNAIAFGQIPDAAGSTAVRFDNVQFSVVDLGDELMTEYTPAPWAQNINGFAEGALPADYGWYWHGPASQLGTSLTSTGGEFILRDTSSGSASYWNRYHLRNAVASNLTWESSVKLGTDPVWTADGQGMAMSDGANMWWVQFNPGYLKDGNGTDTYAVDMTARHVDVRMVKTGTTVALYVDGAHAFDLTATEDDTWGNTIAIGQVMGAGGRGEMRVAGLRVGP